MCEHSCGRCSCEGFGGHGGVLLNNPVSTHYGLRFTSPRCQWPVNTLSHPHLSGKQKAARSRRGESLSDHQKKKKKRWEVGQRGGKIKRLSLFRNYFLPLTVYENAGRCSLDANRSRALHLHCGCSQSELPRLPIGREWPTRNPARGQTPTSRWDEVKRRPRRGAFWVICPPLSRRRRRAKCRTAGKQGKPLFRPQRDDDLNKLIRHSWRTGFCRRRSTPLLASSLMAAVRHA